MFPVAGKVWAPHCPCLVLSSGMRFHVELFGRPKGLLDFSCCSQ